jgi:hypothetical protein
MTCHMPGSSSSPAVSTRYASTPSADLLNLKDLDQKLWVALSCPTTGVEFDARTLALLDSDNDGHIRAPELLAAIDWAAARLNDSQGVRAKARRRAAGRDPG